MRKLGVSTSLSRMGVCALKIWGLPIFIISLLVTTGMREVRAVSQFLNDTAFSIVDTSLSVGTSPTTMGSISPIPPPTSATTLPMSTSTPRRSHVSSQSDLIQTLNPISGFDQPVFLRGTSILNTTSGIFQVDDDGLYFFVIHRFGVDLDNPDLALTLIPSKDGTMNETLATLKDTGAGDVITTRVLAELRRGDRVFIANPLRADIIGTNDNPFIYNGFLLYHPSISSSSGMRQSAFYVTIKGNTSLEGRAFYPYDTPVVNINNDFIAESGTFRVSLKGLYIFHLSATFTALSEPGGRPVVAIVVNDMQRVRVQARVDMEQLNDNAEVTVALPMVKGDVVKLVNVVGNPEIDFFVAFTGYLLN